MVTQPFTMLTLNGGSSSLKFSVYRFSPDPVKIFGGKIEKIGSDDATLICNQGSGNNIRKSVPANSIQEAGKALTAWLKTEAAMDNFQAIGHRIVFGMSFPSPVVIDTGILQRFREASVYDPTHMPGAIALIEVMSSVFPKITQVACFDTAFHSSLPAVATMLPIPRQFSKQGIRRYGFHGLSYASLLEQLNHLAGTEIASKKLILAHLGNGSSMAAVKAQRCVDTTMGFTPTGGFMMGTRTGDLDPSVINYLLKKMEAGKLDQLVNKESGLLGVSGISADIRDLLKEKENPAAAEAVALFCYQAKKSLCGLTGALGGIDCLVFSGGIGENSAEVRASVCLGLDYLGIEIDKEKNEGNATMIGKEGSRVLVYVIPSDEELIIAKSTAAFLKQR